MEGQRTKQKRRKSVLRMRKGFGSIRYISAGRRNAYAVHPPSTSKVREGRRVSVRPGAICYVSDWYTGFAVLTAWHAGKYKPGMEKEIAEAIKESVNLDLSEKGDWNQRACENEVCRNEVCRNEDCGNEDHGNEDRTVHRTVYGTGHKNGEKNGNKTRQEMKYRSYSKRPVVAEYGGLQPLKAYCDRVQSYVLALELEKKRKIEGRSAISSGEDLRDFSGKPNNITLREGFHRFYAYKFGEAAPKKLSPETARLAKDAVRKLAPVLDREMDDLSVDELQAVVCAVKRGRSTVSRVVTLLKEIYKYAVSRELCRRNPALYVRMPDTADYKHHQDFTDEELQNLWENKEDPMARMVLIMCYSGFRVSAYKSLETDTEEWFFRGGIKTASGKNRIVPVHSGIRSFVEEMLLTEKQYLFGMSIDQFCKKMHRKMVELGIDVNGRHHTPHSCRHTFSRLCESYGVREADRKRMMGHSLVNDLTNGVYGHRTLEELRAEIEKIQIPGKMI